jgi:ribonuclease T2
MEMQWIPGYGPDNAFTMHGLWPNMCSGAQGPKDGCDESRQYTDISSYFDSSLLSQMNTYWPSDQGDNSVFWMHEWQKHGTCVSTLAPSCFDSSSYNTGDEVALYFGKALELRQTYDIYAAMNNAGYGPVDSASNGYNVNDVVSAIKSAYGVTVQLECKGSAIDGVRMWFNVRGADTYVPINAPTSTQKCRGTIYLPNKNSSNDNSSQGRATSEGSSSSSTEPKKKRRHHPKRNQH